MAVVEAALAVPGALNELEGGRKYTYVVTSKGRRPRPLPGDVRPLCSVSRPQSSSRSNASGANVAMDFCKKLARPQGSSQSARRPRRSVGIASDNVVRPTTAPGVTRTTLAPPQVTPRRQLLWHLPTQGQAEVSRRTSRPPEQTSCDASARASLPPASATLSNKTVAETLVNADLPDLQPPDFSFRPTQVVDVDGWCAPIARTGAFLPMRPTKQNTLVSGDWGTKLHRGQRAFEGLRKDFGELKRHLSASMNKTFAAEVWGACGVPGCQRKKIEAQQMQQRNMVESLDMGNVWQGSQQKAPPEQFIDENAVESALDATFRKCAIQSGYSLGDVERIYANYCVNCEDPAHGITTDGLHQLLIELDGVEPPEWRVRQAFKLCDEDESGYIEFEEFFSWYGAEFRKKKAAHRRKVLGLGELEPLQESRETQGDEQDEDQFVPGSPSVGSALVTEYATLVRPEVCAARFLGEEEAEERGEVSEVLEFCKTRVKELWAGRRDHGFDEEAEHARINQITREVWQTRPDFSLSSVERIFQAYEKHCSESGLLTMQGLSSTLMDLHGQQPAQVTIHKAFAKFDLGRGGISFSEFFAWYASEFERYATPQDQPRKTRLMKERASVLVLAALLKKAAPNEKRRASRLKQA
mmetsp:Transcript_8225/g.17865  ORF Transcript_8225/g.17865 Transcript_8225/m.17865 type:complete len:640 (-) Transcript_8225:202-2121(-)